MKNYIKKHYASITMSAFTGLGIGCCFFISPFETLILMGALMGAVLIGGLVLMAISE